MLFIYRQIRHLESQLANRGGCVRDAQKGVHRSIVGVKERGPSDRTVSDCDKYVLLIRNGLSLLAQPFRDQWIVGKFGGGEGKKTNDSQEESRSNFYFIFHFEIYL